MKGRGGEGGGVERVWVGTGVGVLKGLGGVLEGVDEGVSSVLLG